MSRIRGKLGLVIPNPKQSRSERFGVFTVSDVEVWMNKLPKNNLGACAKFLHDFLFEMNVTEMNFEDRFKTLEVVFSNVAFVNSAMSERLTVEKTLDHHQMMKISQLMQALTLELCSGYKAVLEETSSFFKRKKKLFLQCLHRITILDLDCLQESYKMHTTPPKHVWHELHMIYQYAEKTKLLDVKVEHFDSRPIRHTTIHGAYKHALLLVCSNPYRFSSHEFVNLNFGLESWASLLILNKGWEQKELFFLDLDSDQPPALIVNESNVGKNVLYLNFEKILERVDLMIRHVLQQGAYHLDRMPLHHEFNLPLAMLRLIKNTWSQPFVRNHDRIPEQGSMRATVGLNATFLAIAHNAGLIPSKTEGIENEGHGPEEIVLGEITKTIKEAHFGSFELHQVGLVDISANGLCIEWSSPVPGALKAGELIGFEANTESHGMLSIAVVCWVKTKDQKTRSGLKILSPYAKPILTIPSNGTQPIKTLLLPADPNAHPFTTLITPLLPFKEGSTVTMNFQDQSYEVVLERDVESSSHFHVFHIKSKDHQDLPFLDFETKKPVDELWSSMEYLKNL